MTHASNYYEPRKATPSESVPITYREPTLLERYGELVATGLGLLTFGFAIGLVVFALVVRP
jgi:hypothetical protein